MRRLKKKSKESKIRLSNASFDFIYYLPVSVYEGRQPTTVHYYIYYIYIYIIIYIHIYTVVTVPAQTALTYHDIWRLTRQTCDFYSSFSYP